MVIGAGHHHLAGLHRLTQGLQHRALELRQLIEKQDAVMGEGNFPWPDPQPAADQRCRAGGVMWVTERAFMQKLAIGEQPGNRVDHRNI